MKHLRDISKSLVVSELTTEELQTKLLGAKLVVIGGGVLSMIAYLGESNYHDYLLGFTYLATIAGSHWKGAYKGRRPGNY